MVSFVVRNTRPRRPTFCIAAVLLSAAACSSGVEPSPTDSTPIPRAVVLGDSLALSPTPELNFTTELQARAEAAGLRLRISSASTWGDTTTDGLRRLDAALDGNPQILVVALGANDGLRGVPVSTVERNLGEIIARARGRRAHVLLTGMEAPPVSGFDYSIQFHLVFTRLAAQHDIPLVPFLLAGVLLNPDMNGPDGVHPNAAGARRIASTVWPYLEPLVRQVLVHRSLSEGGSGGSAYVRLRQAPADRSTCAKAAVDSRPPSPRLRRTAETVIGDYGFAISTRIVRPRADESADDLRNRDWQDRCHAPVP
jgi:acyl-CoA thioesterase-1